jgi:hypothetical protein
MQFMVLAYDGKDAHALDRRLAFRIEILPVKVGPSFIGLHQ